MAGIGGGFGILFAHFGVQWFAHSGRPIALGLAIGIFAAVLGGRLLQSLVFGISPLDPLTFVSVAVIITLVAAVACYIPARRAMTADVVVALHYE